MYTIQKIGVSYVFNVFSKSLVLTAFILSKIQWHIITIYKITSFSF